MSGPRSILAALRDGPKTNRQLQELTRDHGASIARSCNELIRRGLVVRVDGHKPGRGRPATYARAVPNNPDTQPIVPDALLPCPFCGGEADIHHMPDGAHAQCFNCGANSRIFDGARNGMGSDREFAYEDAFQAWNTRTQQTPRSADGVLTGWRNEIRHPNNRLLFKRMVEVAGIDLEADDIATALKKVAALTPPTDEQQ